MTWRLGLDACLIVAALAAPGPASRPAPAVDPALARVIRFLEDRLARDPDDIVALNRLSGDYLARFRDTGDDEDLSRASQTAARSLISVPAEHNPGALAARGHASFALHRFAEARDDARQLLRLEPDKRYPLDLLGDCLLELGDYAAAAETYEKMRQCGDDDPGVKGRTSRLAFLRGDVGTAVKDLQDAVDLAAQLSPPQPQVLSWSRVQLGQVAFMTGDWPTAEMQYLAALEDKPGDWPAIDHLAELRAAQKRYDEAIALYRPLIERVPRPELLQALGDVFRAKGDAAGAKQWHDRARDAYLKATECGAVHYYHHLAGFFCDAQPDAAEAIKWATKDLKIRGGVYPHDGMAWALYQAGDYPAAAKEMDQALSSGIKDAHVLYHAALIYRLAGDVEKAQHCLALAGKVNPRFNEFHVHR